MGEIWKLVSEQSAFLLLLSLSVTAQSFLQRKHQTKVFLETTKSVISATNLASATLAAAELSNTHVISGCVMWITCLIVSSFWGGSSSLMEVTDGPLESVYKTLSIRPHLFQYFTERKALTKPTSKEYFLQLSCVHHADSSTTARRYC